MPFTFHVKWNLTEILKIVFSMMIWCFLKFIMEKLFSFKALLNEKQNYRANECGSAL